MANARWIGDFLDERITLIACYPAWSNTHRVVDGQMQEGWLEWDALGWLQQMGVIPVEA